MEPLGKYDFVETCYPKSVEETVNFFVRAAIARRQPFRLCKSCGRYFAVRHGGVEYCNRQYQDTGKTCREIGSVKPLQKRTADSPAMRLYNTAYKTRFARIRYGKITREEFGQWSTTAREFRDAVVGRMTIDEFETWLKR
ncbi:MAG: DUF6076 domain-containing protein [Clostridiales bacterium]|jgi:hypothetical protein|nr:DUF6076 domain-containing protein [Clostridiales bacterium]